MCLRPCKGLLPGDDRACVVPNDWHRICLIFSALTWKDRFLMLMMTQLALPTLADSPVAAMVERSYRLRQVGLLLASMCIASVLVEVDARPIIWMLLAANVVVWPFIARELALRGRDAHAIETRSLLVDSALGGMWIAMMQFNVLASALLSVMLCCDKAIAGGWRLALRGFVVQLAACVLTLAVHGFAFSPQTTMAEILSALPLLVLYPLAMSMTMHAQARRLGESLALAPSQNDAAQSDTSLRAA
jgi:hypothetical protein